MSSARVLSPLPAIVVLILVMAGCGRPQPKAKPEPVTVVVSTPIQREVTNYIDFTGRTDAVKSVDLRARVSGYLDKINFKDGEEVKLDQLLFEIDRRPYEVRLKIAKANVANLEARVARAKADMDRAAQLFPKQAISKAEYDQFVAALAEATAGLQGTNAQVEQANLDLGFTQIGAPIAGKIGRRQIDAGNLVTADSTLLANVVTMDPIYVYFNVDELTMLQIQEFLRKAKVALKSDEQVEILIGLANEEGYPHRGMVDFVNNRVDPSTGTIRVRATLDNPIVANQQRIFSPGLFVRVRVPLGLPRKALLVTDRALSSDQGQKILYLVNAKNEVEQTDVTVGLVQDGLRVIEQGLKPDDRVIINGIQRVRPGVVVDPKEGPMRGEIGKPDGKTPEAKPRPEVGGSGLGTRGWGLGAGGYEVGTKRMRIPVGCGGVESGSPGVESRAPSPESPAPIPQPPVPSPSSRAPTQEPLGHKDKCSHDSSSIARSSPGSSRS